MRVGSFLLGGIAGVAAVFYLNRKMKTFMFSEFNSSSNSLGKMMNSNKESVSGKAASSSSAPGFSANKQSMTKEKSVKEEPDLQHVVNEILAESQESQARVQ
ncbi:hypothetical protein [Paenibacillus eucommiae]|uniref:Uncharacterized protein n=1 Tax=Paenibacillus eucommiae TaxID=1355755 RepID=A0ABS4IPG5_9BACL|nr:hypothetical protein [Paenibacillus eucommiae]MBP1988921.1 hypothetical protein [Paenibacillus eucommiae]